MSRSHRHRDTGPTRLRKRNAGMSLIEITFATAILTVSLVAVLGSLVQAHEANVILRQRAVALEHARTALNEIRALRSEGLSIPDGVLAKVGEAPELSKDSVLGLLSRQYTFEESPKGLLRVQVEVGWRDMRGRPASLTLATALSNYE